MRREDLFLRYKEELDKIICQLATDGFSIREFVADHDPVSEIERIVAEEKIDLIVTLH